jgi:hypothetical protein
VVVNLPIAPLRWLVLIVVLYAATIMFRAAILGRREQHAEPGTAAIAG